MSSDSALHRVALTFTINACMFVFGIVLFLMGALLPTLHVGEVHTISLGSVPLIGILLATVFAGPVLDLRGAKQMMILALVLIAGSLALLPAFHFYWQLVACSFAYGLGGGILNTATNVLIANLNTQSRASALNLLGFYFSGGAVLAPLLMSADSGRLSPSTVLRLLADLTAAILVPVILFRFPPPLRAGIRFRDLFSVLNQPLVWLFGVILMFESGSENCVFVWAGKVVMDVLHTTAVHGSWALAALGAALGLGRLAAIVWLRWLGSLGTLWLCASFVLTGITIALAAGKLPAMILAMVVIGFGISTVFPTVLGIAGNRFSGEIGTVFSAVITLGLIGGAAGPTIGAYAMKSGALHVLWIPGISAVAVALLTTIAVHQQSIA